MFSGAVFTGEYVRRSPARCQSHPSTTSQQHHHPLPQNLQYSFCAVSPLSLLITHTSSFQSHTLQLLPSDRKSQNALLIRRRPQRRMAPRERRKLRRFRPLRRNKEQNQRPSGTKGSKALLFLPCHTNPHLQKGMVGRGDDNAQARERAENHVSRPLNDLTNPDSFAPPPKRTGTGLAPAPAASTSRRQVITAPSKYQDPHGPRMEAPQKISHEHELEAAEAAPPTKSGPYRTNTTGYTTDNLPLPPTRRDGANTGQPPAITNGPAGGGNGGAQKALPSTQAPSLPPRLPPRGAAGGSPAASSSSPQSTGNSGTLNKGAVDRLGASGVSVPGFGIGQQQNGSPGNNTQNQPSAPPPAQQPGHLGELQNRFSKMRTSEQGQGQPQQDGQSQGTTWAQKQAAAKTASQFHKDPSSVSFSDAKAAASTANNFRERHGEQVASGMRAANNMNQKYGVADKASAFSQRAQGQQTQAQQPQASQAPQQSGVAGKKKPPPPPPKKKPELSAMQPAQNEDAPPPIPMSTRPTF